MEEIIPNDVGPARGVSTSRIFQMQQVMSRVRAAIKEFDPSYRLKARGWICAKEWRAICPPPLDFIWGDGYTGMANRLTEDKIVILRKAAKDTIKIDGWSTDFISLHPKRLLLGSLENINGMSQINGHNIDWDGIGPSVARYMMRDPIWGKEVKS